MPGQGSEGQVQVNQGKTARRAAQAERTASLPLEGRECGLLEEQMAGQCDPKPEHKVQSSCDEVERSVSFVNMETLDDEHVWTGGRSRI